MKSSNTRVMVAAYRLLVEAMEREGMTYPIHLGVTEAGNGLEGRIKSAVGIGALLADGIGDTIRVSLTEAPENEIPVARLLADHFRERPGRFEVKHPERYSPTVYRRRSGCTDARRARRDHPRVPPLGEHVAEPHGRTACGDPLARRRRTGGGRPPLRRHGSHDAGRKGRSRPGTALSGRTGRRHPHPRRPLHGDPAARRGADDPASGARTLLAYRIHRLPLVRPHALRHRGDAGAGQGAHVASEKISKSASWAASSTAPARWPTPTTATWAPPPDASPSTKGRTVVERNIPQKEALDRLIALIRENGDWQEPE